MPWKVVKNHSGCPSSKPFAVIKVSDGKKAGCHTSQKKANAQIAALNISENKMQNQNLKNFPMTVDPQSPVSPEEAGLAATIKSSVIDPQPLAQIQPDVVETKEGGEEKSHHDPIDWLPFGVTSFAELEQFESAREAAFEIAEKSHLFPQMVENIMADENIIDKSAAVNQISTEFGVFVKAKTSQIALDDEKSISQKAADLVNNSEGGLVVWKQNDTYRWLAIYSNNYRDREIEIISAKSHERFVDMVDGGQYPMPVLRHFHVEGTDWGQAEMVHYDKETGFALAAGFVLPDHEHEAEAIMKMDNVPSMSHGMLKSNLRRDPKDSNIIIEHQTIELSDLPFEDAANQLMTNFHIIKEADTMGLTTKKRDYLNQVGVKDVDGLEKSLLAGKTLAQSLNLDSKQNGDGGGDAVPAPAEIPASAPVAPEATPAEAPVVAPVAPAPVAPIEAPAPAVAPVEVAPAATPEVAPEVAPEVSPAAAPPADDSAGEGADGGATEPIVPEGFSEVQTKQLVEVFSTLMDVFDKKIDEKLSPIIATQKELIDNENSLLQQTPLAGLQEIVISKKYLEDQSALTAPNTLLDGRSTLAKDKPAETDNPQPVISSGNGIVDNLAASIVDGSWKDEFKASR